MKSLAAGTQIEGKYEVVHQLKGGGMGEVYLVRHLHLQEKRIIKRLRPELAHDPEAMRRFHREAKTATQIKHPHVATLYDYSRLGDGSFYMVWEFIEGQDIGSWLKTYGPFPLMASINLGIQALRGLEAIHAAQVVHRDISPDNLMITQDNRGRAWIKVIDLGLARSRAETAAESSDGGFGGKLKYCSPEQARAVEVSDLDGRSDLYSFALVLYEMISGQLPFDIGGNLASILHRFERRPLPLSARCPDLDLPPTLEPVFAKALALRREDRFEDAAAFIASLVDVALELEDLRRGGSKPRLLSEEEQKRLRIETVLSEAEEHLASARIYEVRRCLDELTSLGANEARLEDLIRRLSEIEHRRKQMQALQTEELVEQYISGRQHSLACVALEALLEFDPLHPRRDELRIRVESLGVDLEEESAVKSVLEAGLDSLERGDLAAARLQLARLESSSSARLLARQLAQQIETYLSDRQKSHRIEGYRHVLDQLLAEERLEELATRLDELKDLDVPKVVIDLYRGRAQELDEQRQARLKIAKLERLYPQLLHEQRWQEAREVAVEIETLAPDSSRPAQMFQEVSEHEERARRRQAVLEGMAALDSYLAAGELDEAEMAYRIVHQIDPQPLRKGHYEKRLRELRERAP